MILHISAIRNKSSKINQIGLMISETKKDLLSELAEKRNGARLRIEY